MVVLQARAEATRRRIIESAVDLFDELGYGETGLADVLQRAGVSKGAFYYHFDSKEAVASAIIDQFRVQNAERVAEAIDRNAPLLERIIVATFRLFGHDEPEKTAQSETSWCRRWVRQQYRHPDIRNGPPHSPAT